jgi:hypothetical protein
VTHSFRAFCGKGASPGTQGFLLRTNNTDSSTSLIYYYLWATLPYGLLTTNLAGSPS